ncbi:MAG: ferrochelatase [Nitrospira bacterium HGW-Nitrospira-1]|nr:MAG: ferrochelatase [Nitrospira bacterium HGW-Nitrospira-1]
MENKADKTTGVLLLNLGGPDSLGAVKPFLFNLFSDREIIRLGPSFLQRPIAYLISSLRGKKTREAYGLIGGKSPICDITFAQAKALEEVLNKSGVRGQESGENALSPITHHPSPVTFKVYAAMRYWHPLIEDVIHEIYRDGVKRLIVLSLYPQYSVATTGSTLAKLGEVISKYPMEIFSIQSWYDNQLYIDALVDEIKKGIRVFNSSLLTPHSSPPEVHVLFSAHSLPVKFIEEGDPYVDQIKGTINEIVKKLDIRWSLSYQSKSGPVKWLGPSTDRMIEALAAKGIKNLLVAPISFVSDHIETLYEIDILYKGMAEKLGMRLERVKSLNTAPLFISALEDIVLKGMKEAGWVQ